MKSFKNFFLVFITITLSLILYLSGNYSKISTSILSILPDSTDKELLIKINEEQNSKTLLIATKDLSKKSLEKILQIENDLSKIKKFKIKKEFLNKDFEDYKNTYYNYINNFDTKKFLSFDIDKELKTIQDKTINSFFPILLNTQDPLNLFIKPENIEQTNLDFVNNHLAIKNIGYISFFDINTKENSFKEYEDIYDDIFLNIKQDNIYIYSNIFFFVENKRAIKEDINKIILLSSLTLLLLYIVLLRNIKLLFNTSLALFSSAIFAILVVTSIFDEISVFVLAFGISISTVAIDYMFHHFLHEHYEKEKNFNKEVFFGFLTTIIIFTMISFVDFKLITQICIFSISSLSLSYLIFAFIFPTIKFKPYKNLSIINNGLKINHFIFLTISIFLIIITLTKIEFDFDLQNLDYNNKKLQEQKTFFDSHLNKDHLQILISAKDIEALIENFNTIKQKLTYINSPLNYIPSKEKIEKTNELLKSSEFRLFKLEVLNKANEYNLSRDFLYNAYNLKDIKIPNINELENYGINMFKNDSLIYTIVTIKKKELGIIKDINFIKPISTKILFENSFTNVKNQLINIGTIGLIILLLILLFITKKRFLYAINFLIFPIALILFYSYFIKFNILHIFAIFVIIAISIDYAIYSSKNLKTTTKQAIFYSLISTFGGFGVLIFSNINALKSIGVITTIGVIAILILIVFLKETVGEIKSL